VPSRSVKHYPPSFVFITHNISALFAYARVAKAIRHDGGIECVDVIFITPYLLSSFSLAVALSLARARSRARVLAHIKYLAILIALKTHAPGAARRV